jgi:hypothetical protein
MSNLSVFENRVNVLLQDTTQLSFSNALVDESIRLALADYSRASGGMETIAGLDSAETTSIPVDDEGLIVLGAAGYAAGSKAADRKESFNLNQQIPAALIKTGSGFLERFKALLNTVRTHRQWSATDVPWGQGFTISSQESHTG